jgi:hypothetical protein|tara:strand:+ start:81 stop:782 length:702 start_codon:yes stop_codon:yes gene_type:complete
MVRYGKELKGHSTTKLVKDIIEPVNNNVENVKFHILSDDEIRIGLDGKIDICNYSLSDAEIKRHNHWVKCYFFDPKMIGANKDDETIIVDIDMFWYNDPSCVINFPIKEGQFASMPRWWAKDKMKDCPISGNFYKFKSHEFKHVAEIYKKHYHYFKKFYWKNGLVDREDLGEQNFVWDMVKHAELLLQPAHWCFKESPEYPERYIYAFENYTGDKYLDWYDKAIWTHSRKGTH